MIDSVLFIGRPAEMDDIILPALRQAQSARFFAQLEDLGPVEEPVSLIIIMQHWPDEFSPEQIQRLLETFPLSRFLVVQGPWCASARRTRSSWPASFCVPVKDAVNRLACEIEVLAGRRLPLPWTAGMDEIFAFDHG